MTATTLFPLGQVVATQGALAALRNADQSALDFLARHARGDWGEVGKEDTKENALSLREGYRLMSVYTLQGGQKLWIITEADRSVTTLMLPLEY